MASLTAISGSFHVEIKRSITLFITYSRNFIAEISPPVPLPDYTWCPDALATRQMR
jgi:hypothetical protein